MKPVQPGPVDGAQAVTFAQDQPPYAPLAAVVTDDGVVMTEWEPSAEERKAVAEGGRVRLWVWTFRRPLQPFILGAVTAAGEPVPNPLDTGGHVQ